MKYLSYRSFVYCELFHYSRNTVKGESEFGSFENMYLYSPYFGNKLTGVFDLYTETIPIIRTEKENKEIFYIKTQTLL